MSATTVLPRRTAERQVKVRGELRDAFALAGATLRATGAGALAFATGVTRAAEDDPLRLDLPPLLDGTSRPSAATLRLTGTLYLQSELEQAGLIAAAELLVSARDTLPATEAVGTLLEQYARAMRGAGVPEWLPAARRTQLFARLFGTGTSAAPGGTAINQSFEQLVASLCASLLRVEAGYRWSSTPDAMLDASVRQAAVSLLVNVGARQYGVSSVLAGRLDQQLRRSIALLSHRDVASLLGVQGVWTIVRTLLGPNATDAGRHAARGASGQAIFAWLAGVLPSIESSSPQTLVPPGSPAFAPAGRWIVASGLAVPGGPVQ
jgi:hypothetical protein